MWSSNDNHERPDKNSDNKCPESANQRKILPLITCILQTKVLLSVRVNATAAIRVNHEYKTKTHNKLETVKRKINTHTTTQHYLYVKRW